MTLTQTITRPKRQTEVINWFKAEEFSFAQETALANSAAGLALAGQFDIGLVLGRIASGAPGAAAANAGNAGNGTVGTVTDQIGAQVGTYEIEFIAATKFNVYDPAGKLVGPGTTGTAFANQLGFTIAAGGTAFAAGDGFTIAVVAGSGKVVPLNPSATDGSQNAIGVVARRQTIQVSADTPVTVVRREAVLLADGLIWPAGISADQQAAAVAQLATGGLLVKTAD